MPRGRRGRRRCVVRIAEVVRRRVCGVLGADGVAVRVVVPPGVNVSRKVGRWEGSLGRWKVVVSRKQWVGRERSSSSMVLRLGLCV